jgi:hypothetical protein
MKMLGVFYYNGLRVSMTNTEALDFYEELVAFYGTALANFEHYPRIFAHQVQLYRYYKERKLCE